MRVLLNGLLPRLFPGLPFKCVKHEGKTDLERSIPRKLRAWRSAIPTPCRARTRCSSVSFPSSRRYPAPAGWHSI